jgi:6-pyruvoyltetrahydropterin/6-carboxytetrahydropterin synthase
MYRIRKSFEFSASHQLDHLPTGHQCSRLHGHNYLVTLELAAAALDSRDFVLDYGDLGGFRFLLNETLDHRHLNDVVPVRSTAENLAAWLFMQAKQLYGDKVVAVEVCETPKTSARYERDV